MTPQADDAIQLFRIAEEKIEAIRSDVSEMVRHDVQLSLKVDHLADRVDKGVSVTGQKTLEIVTNLVSQIAAYRVDQENLERLVENHKSILDRILSAVFLTATVGVIGGLVTLFIGLLRHFSDVPH